MSEQLDKLKRIRARCVELLALAEKRTPGEWETDKNSGRFVWPRSLPDGIIKVYTEDNDTNDSAFIAACAGPAEAGWRSTIAAIDAALGIVEFFDGKANHPLHVRENEIAEEIGRAILPAWEGLI